MTNFVIGVAIAATLAGLIALGAKAAIAETGAVEQTVGPPVSQKPALPPLHLSDDQRTKIRQALSGVDSEVDFQLKTTKPAKSFNPTVGAVIPKGLKPQTLPAPVLAEMPALKNYTCLKFKHQVLIIDPMHRKIVDMFPEA